MFRCIALSLLGILLAFQTHPTAQESTESLESRYATTLDEVVELSKKLNRISLRCNEYSERARMANDCLTEMEEEYRVLKEIYRETSRIPHRFRPRCKEYHSDVPLTDVRHYHALLTHCVKDLDALAATLTEVECRRYRLRQELVRNDKAEVVLKMLIEKGDVNATLDQILQDDPETEAFFAERC